MRAMTTGEVTIATGASRVVFGPWASMNAQSAVANTQCFYATPSATAGSIKVRTYGSAANLATINLFALVSND